MRWSWEDAKHCLFTCLECLNCLTNTFSLNWIGGMVDLLLSGPFTLIDYTQVSWDASFWEGSNKMFFSKFFWNEEDDCSWFWKSLTSISYLINISTSIAYSETSVPYQFSMGSSLSCIMELSWTYCKPYAIGMVWQNCACTMILLFGS